ncbi:MAG: prepilin-type N-terminal cleavage/methylation domain-containing protein [Deltaproteobacteria bacterium]|nr:MAG: prepilin-type N-terminal cleavage/methylation domain-containing protein [Deltaproteobacteria bacterium]TMA56125.1 MAG: prepilin-type N-terminal cleavage/methylation domain-containing protein [Deltaproteobacteria bacterium]
MSRGARGFTLLEMAMVLLIIAVGSALVVPMIEGGFDNREVRRAARQLAATMHYCRGEAVALGKPQELVIDAVQNTVRTSGGRSGALSDRAVIERIQGGFEPEQGIAQILFYPNGSTTGVDVLLASRRDRAQGGQNRILVHLDPLVGTVAVRDATP